MKKRTIYSWMLCLSLLAGGATTLTSCRDEFTEEEVLKEQQTIDFTVTAFDLSEAKGLAGATVSFSQNGQKMESTTNEAGVANFADVKIGSNLIVTISKEGFATTRKEIGMQVDSYRESQISNTFNMYALDGASTAIIRGKAQIETDVTNDRSEVLPAGTTVEAYFKVPSQGAEREKTEISVKGQTDANGMYSIKVPATRDMMNYALRFPTLELDQKIAKNADAAEKQVFPAVLPSIENIKTLFTPSGTGLSVPQVGAVYALATPNDTAKAAVKRPAQIWVTVGEDGKVTGLQFQNRGSGYIGTVTLEVKSVSGLGSGAVVKVDAVGGGLLGTVKIENGGSGYPVSEEVNLVHEDTAVNQNFTGGINPTVASGIGVTSGDIKVVNVHYGTGTSRAKDIK
jgi:hypothetical protein